MQGCGGTMNEQKVKLVMGLDGRPTGEAYVEISGPGAKYRLALAKDRQLMPVRSFAHPAVILCACTPHVKIQADVHMHALGFSTRAGYSCREAVSFEPALMQSV